MMSKRKTYHMTSNTDGGWKIKEEKASRAPNSQDTKVEAVDRAKELTKTRSSESSAF